MQVHIGQLLVGVNHIVNLVVLALDNGRGVVIDDHRGGVSRHDGASSAILRRIKGGPGTAGVAVTPLFAVVGRFNVGAFVQNLGSPPGPTGQLLKGRPLGRQLGRLGVIVLQQNVVLVHQGYKG